MEVHTCASICDSLPTLSTNHPWLVDQSLALEEDSRDHILYTMRDPPSRHRFRIPSFLGRRIRDCFYGWVILSNHPHNDMWSLWNPVRRTANVIRLPRLIPKNEDPGSTFVQQCCLSSPPDDPGSIFMVTAEKKYAIVFCRLDCKRKRLKWVELSYAKQMRTIAGDDGFLYSLTCCNGKVYALNSVRSNLFVIHVDIVVKGRETVISLLPFFKVPPYYMNGCPTCSIFLKGCCTELFYIEIGINKGGHVEKKTVGGVRVYKLDMTHLRWEEMEDLKEATFFLDLAHDESVFYNPTTSNLGGYVHFLGRSGKVTHSFDSKNKTIALSYMPSPLLATSLFECSEQQEVVKESEEIGVWDGEVDSNTIKFGTRGDSTESRLVNIPFDVLKTIMEFCAGVEYLKFRATCKQCQLAAPMIQWSKDGRLQTYSLVSPWLMLLDKDHGLISFIDPVFGDKYFIKTPQDLIGDLEIHCSMCGWLLIRRRLGPLMFFNPFTSDIRVLPPVPYLDTYCFSAPPTSSDCMVVGFTTLIEWHVYIHFVGREPFWRRFHLNFCSDYSRSFHFATIYDENYALYNNGGLAFINTDNLDYTWLEGPGSNYGFPKQNFLVKCDQQLLLVTTGEFGEFIEVFKLIDSTGWEKIESLGRHAVYICDKACICIEAKTPEMENKIYFPRIYSKSGKIVFYSLETRRYHTFNGKNIEGSFGDFMGTKYHLDPHVWIEPSWS